MDQTLYVCYIENSEAPEKTGKYKKGYIIDVYDRDKVVEPPYEGSRFVFIHLLGIPDNYKVKVIVKEVIDVDPITGKLIYVNRRKWYVDFTMFSAETIAELETNRETEKTWTIDYLNMLKNYETGEHITEDELING